jgi:hypothetical protein
MMKKGKNMGVETGKSHESPERASMLAACELRRVDMDIYRLRRELAAAAAQREAILKELKQTAKANGLDPNDYYDGNINTASPSDE